MDLCFHFYWVNMCRIAELYGKYIFNVTRNFQTLFQSNCTILHCHHEWEFPMFCSFTRVWCILFLIWPILTFVQWYLTVISMKNDVQHLPIRSFAIYISLSLVEHLIKSFAHFLLFIFLLLYYENIYSGYKSFIKFMFYKYLLAVYDMSFYFFRDVFQRTEALNFEKVQFINCFILWLMLFVSSLILC